MLKSAKIFVSYEFIESSYQLNSSLASRVEIILEVFFSFLRFIIFSTRIQRSKILARISKRSQTNDDFTQKTEYFSE